MSEVNPKPLFVFLHGAGLGAFIWEELVDNLSYDTVCIDYPLRANAAKLPKSNTLQAYVNHCESQLQAYAERKIVLVVHSIGGCVGLELAARLGSRLQLFIGLSAAIPPPGGAFMDMFSPVPRLLTLAFLKLLGTKPPAKVIQQTLCTGLADHITERITQSYTPEPLALYTDRITAGLPAVNRFYICFQEDKSFTLSQQQKFAAQLAATETITIPGGHLAMLSHGAELASCLESFVRLDMTTNTRDTR